ncbi:hypothetical protein [Streptomyces atratus]
MIQASDLKPMFRDELGFLSNFDTVPVEMPLLGGATVPPTSTSSTH